MISNDLTETGNNKNYSITDEDGYESHPFGRPPAPITPKMLIKTLKALRKDSFKGLFFTPKEVASELHKNYPNIEQDFEILLLEVSDKLACAAAVGLIETKQDLGYCAHDFRQKGNHADSKSELMFWVFYKKLLNRKLEGGKREKEDGEQAINKSEAKELKRKEKLFASSVDKKKHIRDFFRRRKLSRRNF